MTKSAKNTMPIDTDILTVQDVAKYLKLNDKTTYRLTATGKIPGFKVGGTWRFRKSDIDSWIQENTGKS